MTPNHANLVNSEIEKNHLWQALLKAHDDQAALLEISYEVGRLRSCVEGPEAQIEHPISEGLRALIARTKELSDGFQGYEQEIEGFYQEAAWRYVKEVHGISKGDRIEFTEWQGQTVVGSANELHLHEAPKRDLVLHVLLMKKDGKVGKRDGHIWLAEGKWRNLDSETETTCVSASSPK